MCISRIILVFLSLSLVDTFASRLSPNTLIDMPHRIDPRLHTAAIATYCAGSAIAALLRAIATTTTALILAKAYEDYAETERLENRLEELEKEPRVYSSEVLSMFSEFTFIICNNSLLCSNHSWAVSRDNSRTAIGLYVFMYSS